MTWPEVKGYASYSNYYNTTNKSNEGLVLFGGKTQLNSGTTLSAGVGNDWNVDSQGHSKNYPAMEFKAVQKLGSAHNVNFNAQGRVRYIDGKTQLRGTLGADYKFKNGVKPYAAAHFTTKEGVNTTGGWLGCSYKNLSAGLQGNYNIKSKESAVLVNFMVNI